MTKSIQNNVKTKKKKRLPLNSSQLHNREKKAHEKSFLTLFQKMGFLHVPTDGEQITFMGRTGEFDAFFIFQNILLIVEYTVGKPDSAHLLKKKVLYDLILGNSDDFLEFAEEKFPKLKTSMDPLYTRSVFKLRFLYVSKHEPSEEVINVCPGIHFIHGSTAKYFHALVGTIERSARIEFLKFLRFNHRDVGEGAISSSQNPLIYDGFLLPEGNSSYPKNFKIVSFYADPERLISRSYVLRRDSWRDDSHLYQRILISKKIKQMRKYLFEDKRVFVNNIIVTLPPETLVTAVAGSGREMNSSDLGRVQAVSVQIPDGFDMIGLVDGQHRVFCYHEGSDRGESEIKILRKRQNLMVTGIVYPNDFNELARRSFEAKLFLEINDNQARAHSSLKHDIEVIIKPFSGIAIAKRVLQMLGRKGIYKGMLQTSFFDDTTKIKTSSIVSYGLLPLVKLGGSDSLFSAWTDTQKNKLIESNSDHQFELLEKYIEFCVQKINEFFVAVKLAKGDTHWGIDVNPRPALLSPTAINGLIVCLRKIIEDGHELSDEAHKKNLKKIGEVDFSSFKSSQWQKLGTLLYTNHYI